MKIDVIKLMKVIAEDTMAEKKAAGFFSFPEKPKLNLKDSALRVGAKAARAGTKVVGGAVKGVLLAGDKIDEYVLPLKNGARESLSKVLRDVQSVESKLNSYIDKPIDKPEAK